MTACLEADAGYICSTTQAVGRQRIKQFDSSLLGTIHRARTAASVFSSILVNPSGPEIWPEVNKNMWNEWPRPNQCIVRRTLTKPISP